MGPTDTTENLATRTTAAGAYGTARNDLPVTPDDGDRRSGISAAAEASPDGFPMRLGPRDSLGTAREAAERLDKATPARSTARLREGPPGAGDNGTTTAWLR